MTPANMSYQPCKGTLGKVRRRQESIKKAAGKLRNSLGLRSETSTRVSLRLSQLRCAGGPTQRLVRAGSSCQEQLDCGPAICPATCPFSVFPPSLPEGRGQRRLLALLLLFSAFSQEAGVTRGSWPSTGTASPTALGAHHGPRGRFAAQQRRRRRQPRRRSTASLTADTTALHSRKTIATNGRRLLTAPQNTFAIDSSYVNNYGRRGAAGGAGERRMGAVRHAQGSATGGKAPARPSKWRQRWRACVRNSYAVAPRPAGSEVLRRAARSVRRLRTPGGQRKGPGGKTDSARRVPARFGERGSERNRLLPSVSAAPTPRSRGDADAESHSPPAAAALAAASATTLSGYDQKRITGLPFIRRWDSRR